MSSQIESSCADDRRQRTSEGYTGIAGSIVIGSPVRRTARGRSGQAVGGMLIRSYCHQNHQVCILMCCSDALGKQIVPLHNVRLLRQPRVAAIWQA